MLRETRWTVSQASRLRELRGPAPLDEFADYDDYWARRGRIPVVLRRWELAAQLIPDNTSVLDVGCGSGQFLEHLRATRPGCSTLGIDESRHAVTMTRMTGNAAEVLDVANEEIPGLFDYVTCFEVIEHIADAETVLHRLMSSTRRQAFISIPNVGFIGCRLRLAAFGRFPTTCCIFHIREHVRHWTTRDFAEWIESAGYRLSSARAQHGVWPLARWAPALFASGMLYVVEHPSDAVA